MRSIVVTFLVLTVACTQVSGPPVTPAATSITPAATAAPNEYGAARTPAPSSAATATPAPPPVTVTMDTTSFPVVTTLTLREVASDGETVDAARRGVQNYLHSLDGYRDSGFHADALGLTGAFREAVIAGLKASATPGVKRKFELEELTVLRRFAKPWGTQALVDARVTVVDRAVEGNAAPQRETGVLRLSGDRALFVRDAWDGSRWFNGVDRPDAATTREQLSHALSHYLTWETWVPGSELTQWRGTPEEATPFSTSRATRVAAIDRTQIAARAFADIVARIERFETFAEISTGIATVSLTGTLLTTDPAGRVSGTPFERRVRALVFGGWVPEIVDEEVGGAWVSGGQLALEKVDINRA